jgi:hypothetical protein
VETAKFQDQLYELKKQQAEIKNQLVTKETESQSQSQDSSANQTPEITTSFIYKGRVISKRNGEWKINDDFKRFKSLEEAERYIELLPPRIREIRKYDNGTQKSESVNLMTVWGLLLILVCVGMAVIFGSYKNKEPDENKQSSKNSINKKIQEKNSTSVKNENLSTLNKISKWESLGFKKIAYCAATYGVASGFTNGQDVEEYKKKQNAAIALIYGISKKNSLDLDEVNEMIDKWGDEKIVSYGNIMRQKKYTLPNGNIDTETLMVLVKSEDSECNNYLNSVLASNRAGIK